MPLTLDTQPLGFYSFTQIFYFILLFMVDIAGIHQLLSQRIFSFIQNCKITCESVDTNYLHSHLMEIFSLPPGGCYHFHSSHLTLILKAHSPSFIGPTVTPYLLSDQMQPSEPDGKGLENTSRCLMASCHIPVAVLYINILFLIHPKMGGGSVRIRSDS